MSTSEGVDPMRGSGEAKGVTEDVVSVSLRIGGRALDILTATEEEMSSPDAPEIALIQLADRVFTLGGERIAEYAERLGGALVDPEAIDASEASQAVDNDSVTLLMGKRSLEALEVDQSRMNGFTPPPMGIVRFGDVYRFGGDMIANYVEANGGRVLRGNHLSERGADVQGENSLN